MKENCGLDGVRMGLERVRMGLRRGWPGGTCGAVLSSASRAFRIRSDFGIGSSVTGSNTAEPGKGLAVFKHYAHSAGPD